MVNEFEEYLDIEINDDNYDEYAEELCGWFDDYNYVRQPGILDADWSDELDEKFDLEDDGSYFREYEATPECKFGTRAFQFKNGYIIISCERRYYTKYF